MRLRLCKEFCLAISWVLVLSACGASDNPRESSGSSTLQTTTTAKPVESQRDAKATAPSDASADASSAPAALTPKTLDASDSVDPACYKAGVTVCQLELAILAKTNAHRHVGAELKLDANLSFVARAWSAQQQLVGAIGHAGFPEARETSYLSEFGVTMPYFLGAENVGTTFGTDKLTVDQLADEIVSMWWSSAGHRANILGNYQMIGVGISISADARTVMATQLFGAE